MAKHDFAILNEFDKDKDYSMFSIDEFETVSVDDDIILPLCKYLKNMKTYYFSYSREEKNLNYYGITIIPVSSLMFFYDIVTTLNQFKKSTELTNLQALIIDAKRYEKPLIHFGI